MRFVTLDQHSDFPNIVYSFILNGPEKHSIPIYNIREDSIKLRISKHDEFKTFFYSGIIPKTIGEYTILHSILFTNKNLSEFGTVAFIPKYYLKIIDEYPIEFIIGTLKEEYSLNIDLDYIKEALAKFFGIHPKGVLISSKEKAIYILKESYKKYIYLIEK